jgi:diguanylate cyclase (GGDEF)-like protein/PAS domain S-box-containing protein
MASWAQRRTVTGVIQGRFGTMRRATSAVRRDRVRSEADDEQRQQELCQIMWGVRHAALVVSLVVLAVRGGDEWPLVVGLAVWSVSAHVVVRRRRTWAVPMTTVDAAVVLGAAAAGAPLLLIVVLAVCVLGWAAGFRPRPAAAVASLVLSAAVVSTTTNRIGTGSRPLLAGFVMLGGIFVVRTVRMNLGARRAAEREELVARGIDAILWETIPGDDAPGAVGAMKVSAAAQRILGYPSGAWNEPGFLSSLVHEDDRELLEDHLSSRREGSITVRVRRIDGTERWMELRPTWLRDGAKHDFAVGLLLDRTEQVEAERIRAEAEAQVQALARQDDLTGLLNRRGFVEQLELRSGDLAAACGAVVVLDLDDFKDINDALGHETGDQLLRRVGQCLVDAVGTDDVVARLGGDEFAILLCGVDLERATATVRGLVDRINEPVVVGDLRLRVRASAGLVPAVAGSTTQPLQLLRCADVAMYVAKDRGAGVMVYDAESDMFDRTRLELVTALEAAIRDDQLVLHHQPLVGVATSCIVATEALARWEHPTLGLVPPDRFIDLAEVSGQIRQLSRWVIRRALLDLVALGDAGADLDVSVNLSVRNLYEVDLVEWIAETLGELGVEPHRLVIEVTESTVMDDQPAAVKVLGDLRAMGVRTWIDDFGTGHSSFARLRSLPVDGVKIDRSFVADACVSADGRTVLRSMVELLTSLGLQTIAEGVEQEPTMQLLERIGCTTAQGFALGRPMPVEQLRAVLDARYHAGDGYDQGVRRRGREHVHT